ncbi:hypothetical protein MXD62_32895 [Frankia sp. Mgl5]|nr:hypothetical protein [Frankia sp. Mgl5]MCK9931882.1 hypothetical protein [Frankia sp. Mgl5]
MMIILISVAVGAVLAVALFKLMWRVAEPNEALIISGMRAYKDPNDAVAESLGFKIVTGKGVLVPPGVQTVRRMSLDLRAAQLGIECVTQQGIPVGVRVWSSSRSVTTTRPSRMPPAGSSTSRTRWTPGCTTFSPAICAPSSAS